MLMSCWFKRLMSFDARGEVIRGLLEVDEHQPSK
jgi:hypothetical protein